MFIYVHVVIILILGVLVLIFYFGTQNSVLTAVRKFLMVALIPSVGYQPAMLACWGELE